MTSQKVMISFTSQQLKHLSERDVSKSNIDTTIDFVKLKNNTFLKTIPKNNLE